MMYRFVCRTAATRATPLRAGLGGAVLALLSACALPPSVPGPGPAAGGGAPLSGTEWRLQDMSGRAVLDHAPATLAFPEAGRVAGQGSCNRFFGSVAVDANHHIRLHSLGSTGMACADAINEQERRYLSALHQVHHYEIRDAQLLLYVQGQDRPLRFVRTRP